MPTVLVVDDDRDTTDLYCMVLMSKGHIVLAAHSLQEAVEKAYTHKGAIDVLLTDLYLGDGLGTELVHLLGKRVPRSAVLVTGKDPWPSQRHKGFEDYLIKPVDCDLLCKTVQNCADLHVEEEEAKVA